MAIAPTPEENVSVEVRDGLREVLARSANVGNRAKKEWSFRSSSSEDAITWTVFRFLQDAGLLDRVAVSHGLADLADGSPELLLWGTAVPPDSASELEAALGAVSRELGETDKRFTEPDVVIRWPRLLVVIEAKYRSGNETGSDLVKHAKYVNTALFTPPLEDVAAANRYELVRNWRVAHELARRLGAQQTRLVNLGRPQLARSFADFHSLIVETDERRAVHMAWDELLSGVDPPYWLKSYLERLQPDAHVT
ncbi:MAG: nuclease-related domain-containing protein [Thermoleophilaceae bacterium]